MAGWCTGGTLINNSEYGAITTIFLVYNWNYTYCAVLSLALIMCRSGCCQAGITSRITNITCYVSLPMALAEGTAANLYGEYGQLIAGYIEC